MDQAKRSRPKLAFRYLLCTLLIITPVASVIAQSPEQLIEQAREAARKDLNTAAADLFRRAIEASPDLRESVLHEYADQLTYTSRAAEAVALYREILSRQPSDEERRRAERGLALALLWSGKAEEAVEAWLSITATAPEDLDAKKNLREALVNAARAAAGRDQNVRSAELFARAVQLAPGRRSELLQEYAQQLTYSGRAAQAVPLFLQVLSGRLSHDERNRAQRGLALALLWSGKEERAVEAWQQIVSADPGDQDAKMNLREALVSAAREAGERNQNARAAEFLERAIRIQPDRRLGILRIYAEQLTYSGRAARAVPLYDEVLARGNLSREDARLARRGRALALLWSGKFSQAIDAWEAILRASPRDQDTSKNLTNALVGAARQAAFRDRNTEAADLLARAIDTTPSRRLELAVEYANQLTYSDRAAKAVPIYREVLTSGRLGGDERRSALLGLALALSWSNQLTEALESYDQIILAYPDSVDARVGRARVLAWTNRNKEALDEFERAIAIAPDNREAIRGAAQATSALGRQRLALARLAPLLGSGADVDTLIVAGRAELWKGRPDLARAIALQILDQDPRNPDARKILAEIERNQRPLTALEDSVSHQNNGLVIAGGSVRQSVSLNEGLTTLGLQYRALSFDPETGDDVLLQGSGVFGRHRFNDVFELNSSVYLNRLSSEGFIYIEPTHDTWLTIWPNDFLRFDVSASRSYFDDIQSLASNIRMDSFGLSADLLPDPDLRLTARGSYGLITDGNERLFGQLEAEAHMLSEPDLFLGARYTVFDYHRPELNSGYFNPDWLHSVEGTLRLQTSLAPGWDVAASGGAGYEWQPDTANPIWSASVSTSYAISDRLQLKAEVRHQSAASTGGSGGFERTTFTGGLQFRW